MRSFIIAIIICILGGVEGFAQDVKLEASAPSVVGVGEQFKLVYTLSKKGENMKLPTLKGFELLMGPSVSEAQNVTIINGKATVEASVTYSYILIADEEGEYTIDPATIVVDGKEIKSKSLKIKVVKDEGTSRANRGQEQTDTREVSGRITEDNLFLRLEVNRSSLYVGESLVATLKVYSRVDLNGFGRTKFPAFDGFLAENVDVPRVELKREEYNGKIYDVGVLKQDVLFPQHAGVLTIEPFELDCRVLQRVGGAPDYFDSFFGNSRTVTVLRRTKPVKITVKNLPEAGKPLGFSGMVGTLSMSTSLSPDTLKANDALTYKVIFKGTGNLKLLEAPRISLPPDFDIFDPKVTKDLRTTVSGSTGTVTYEYLLIPRFAGDYTIPSIEYSFFDPLAAKYKVLKGKEYKVHVLKGNDTGGGIPGNTVQSFKKEDVRMLGEDIRYIKTGNSALKAKGVQYFASTAYWLSFLIPFILFVIGMILNRRRIKANADLVRVKSKAASKMAQKRLKAAAVAMKSGNSELFYQEVLKALWGYVSFKLNIEVSELNRDNINEHLTKRGASAELIQNFIDVLDHCEYARYAPGSNQGEEMDKVYKDGLTVITKLDKAL